MSRVKRGREVLTGRFPRVSGDEPGEGGEPRVKNQFSPRERG